MELHPAILIQAGIMIATLATLKAGQAANNRRLRNLERKFEELPKAYVPRTEVELALKGIEGHARHTNSMIEAMIFGGYRRSGISKLEASAAERDFIRITIEGVDGRGGLNLWEGRIPFLYPDTREIDGTPAPLVTVGVGCAIDLSEALTLPFEIDSRRATLNEISDDFHSICRSPFGHKAHFYAGYTRCRLPGVAIDNLVASRFAVFIPALRHLFPSFDLFPETAKAGCLDLIYGVGVAGLSAPHYPAFRAAVNNFNWSKAARESGSDTSKRAYSERNKARYDLFMQSPAS